MDFFAFPPLAVVLDAAYGALHGLTSLLTPLGSIAAATAILLVTLLVRALLIPVGVSQAKAEPNPGSWVNTPWSRVRFAMSSTAGPSVPSFTGSKLFLPDAVSVSSKVLSAMRPIPRV